MAFIKSVKGMPFKIPTKKAVIINAIKALILAPEIKTNNNRILVIRISKDMNYDFVDNNWISIERNWGFKEKKTCSYSFFSTA